MLPVSAAKPTKNLGLWVLLFPIFSKISISLLSPEFVLNKFYPKYNYLDLDQIQNSKFDTNKEIRIKVTRVTGYGDRYKLFIIDNKSFENNYNLEEYGINLVNEEGRITVDTLKWNGLAKKSGMETGDVITNFKVENLNRTNKALVYPFSFIFLAIFGYLNYKRK